MGLQILRQVHVIAPISSNFLIDVARARIEERFEITILAQWSINRLPNVPLLAGPSMIAERAFVIELLLHRAQHQPVDVSVTGQGRLAKAFLAGPRVGPVIDIDDLKEMKIDRIGTVSIG